MEFRCIEVTRQGATCPLRRQSDGGRPQPAVHPGGRCPVLETNCGSHLPFGSHVTNGLHVIVGSLATTGSLVPTPDVSTIASSARCQQLSEQKFQTRVSRAGEGVARIASL
jgi:hypothetical protein